jgi:hypothetical protein
MFELLQAWNTVKTMFSRVLLAMMSLDPMTTRAHLETACLRTEGAISGGTSQDRHWSLSRWLRYAWEG